ncbi:uncharacterized protein RAG0_03545 [Rhynchosporium agropyri]|uniref:MARVEL domain-containing protein n=3 Tax=Rhynchosporium TaxID=38037 RepID=A0A1E1MIA0_RHYSE|nr:uncharacterized protein RAG0_03545 [Rhynchosporium agropyri]CZT07408.1 uncharacterized protein RCO7_07346 [Rhynchosporium commune]CZT48797.1 uncharacterized protein RSE6_09549 [Rhynchosporium secalis]
MPHTRQQYPEPLRHINLFLRTLGLGLSIALLSVAIIVTTKTGDTPPITYVAVIWSILVNVFDWSCLLVRSRIAPGGLLSMDLIAVGLLVGGVINLAVVNYDGDGDRKFRDQGSLTTAQNWLHGILIAVHTILIGYHCLDCNMRRYREEEVVRVRSSRGTGSRRSSRRGSYRETETVRVTVRK